MKLSTMVAVAGIGLGSALMPRAAQAACSTGALQVCAAFNASTYQIGSQWYLRLEVWNLYDAGNAATGQSNVITWAGIGSSWTGTAALSSATYGGSSVAWSLVTNINSNPVGSQISIAASGNNGINNGLIGCYETAQNSQLNTCYSDPNKALVLTFTTSSEFTLTGAVEGWHSQAINGTQCSGWFATNGETTTTVASSDCGSVVPEPITMTLLATGLAGLGGVGFVRKRKGFDVENA